MRLLVCVDRNEVAVAVPAAPERRARVRVTCSHAVPARVAQIPDACQKEPTGRRKRLEAADCFMPCLHLLLSASE